jgi:hypothetical protein
MFRTVCAWCQRETHNGQPVGTPLSKPEQVGASHGICAPCLERVSPEAARRRRERQAVKVA